MNVEAASVPAEPGEQQGATVVASEDVSLASVMFGGLKVNEVNGRKYASCYLFIGGEPKEFEVAREYAESGYIPTVGEHVRVSMRIWTNRINAVRRNGGTYTKVVQGLLVTQLQAAGAQKGLKAA